MAKKTPDVFKVDFRKEEEGGGQRSVRVKPGDYHAKIEKINVTEAKSSGNPMLVFYFKLIKSTGGKKASGSIRDNIVIQGNTLWKLRQLLETIGMEVPKKVVGVPLKKMIGKSLVISVDDGEPYKGKIKSEVVDYLDPDAVTEPDEDDDDDDDDGDPDEALDDMDRAELKKYIKEKDLDIKVKKTMDEDDIREAIRDAEPDEDDDDDDEDDDDDLEELDVDDDL